MLYKFVAAAVIATAIVGGSSVAQAQNDPLFAQVVERLYACNRNYRPACVQLGVLLAEHKDKWPEWRQTYPDWFFWE